MNNIKQIGPDFVEITFSGLKYVVPLSSAIRLFATSADLAGYVSQSALSAALQEQSLSAWRHASSSAQAYADFLAEAGGALPVAYNFRAPSESAGAVPIAWENGGTDGSRITVTGYPAPAPGPTLNSYGVVIASANGGQQVLVFDQPLTMSGHTMWLLVRYDGGAKEMIYGSNDQGAGVEQGLLVQAAATANGRISAAGTPNAQIETGLTPPENRWSVVELTAHVPTAEAPNGRLTYRIDSNEFSGEWPALVDATSLRVQYLGGRGTSQPGDFEFGAMIVAPESTSDAVKTAIRSVLTGERDRINTELGV